MYVAEKAGAGALSQGHHIGAETQIWHKVRIHDIEMQSVRAGRGDPTDFVGQKPEIRRQQRGQYLNVHWLMIIAEPAGQCKRGGAFLWNSIALEQEIVRQV